MRRSGKRVDQAAHYSCPHGTKGSGGGRSAGKGFKGKPSPGGPLDFGPGCLQYGGAEIGKPGGAVPRERNELDSHRSSLSAEAVLGTAVTGFLGKSRGCVSAPERAQGENDRGPWADPVLEKAWEGNELIIGRRKAVQRSGKPASSKQGLKSLRKRNFS